MYSISIPQLTVNSPWVNHSNWNLTRTPTPQVCTNASSQVIQIIAGMPGQDYFNPSSINVTTGTVLRFEFLSLNYTLSQSDATHPCSNASVQDPGLQQHVPLNISGASVVEYVVESNQPQWFYCSQALPTSHCHPGMLFSLNPTHTKPEYIGNISSSHSSTTMKTTPKPESCSALTSSTAPYNTVASAGTNSLYISPTLASVVPDLSNNGHRISYALSSLVAGLFFVLL